ncbi:hypothetical protein SOCE26_010360 [Sorangium cellulosum]|uniref:Gingipain domain-containing protein n=1 Tax=Sorangium cellulosum TaxID=56 RepID=A0A2L0EK16_SORCE|nr:hypothetical protein [Sorangium cellulosum]AUX39641.1 hypothetical protein SOCE26_010360 [Sorangium cellulosum]
MTPPPEPPRDDLLYFNGIDGDTGQYLTPPLALSDAIPLASPAPDDRGVAYTRARSLSLLTRVFKGLPPEVDPLAPSSAGWAIVFPDSAPAELRKALEPLIEHRRAQVAAQRFKILEYKAGDTAVTWVKRHGGHLADVRPWVIPYYLLLVGGPDVIPFEFQYLLGLEYAVGRLSFETAAEYLRYAESVVAYEASQDVPTAREAVFWGTRHDGDQATALSAEHLLGPLCNGLPAGVDVEQPPVCKPHGFRARCFLGDDATKANLADVLHGRGPSRPSLLFTASHGVGWKKGDPRQERAQGALLCQDWSGFGACAPEDYLSGDDIADDAQFHGLVAFLFACHGAGTPLHSDFVQDRKALAPAIADRPFVAALPRRLLSHPSGSALAVIAHVERVWSFSIKPLNGLPQIGAFRNCLGRILAGQPVGHAARDFSHRYSALSTVLTSALDSTRTGDKLDERELVNAWIERNDAQGYVTLGDPAARLRVDKLK